MRVVVLSHRSVAHELGHLEPWLDAVATNGLVRAYREDGPDESALMNADLLVVLGSPGSAAAGHCQPAADREIELVRWWVSGDRPYLGICFGAQVLARALGGSVQRMPSTYRDYPLLTIDNGAPADLAGPWTLWHEDAINSPPDAATWARLPHADIAFRRGRAWGLQPHVEVTSESLERMLEALGVPSSEADDVLETIRAAEASADPPARRVSRLLRAFEGSSLG